jgi:hypothetical protein
MIVTPVQYDLVLPPSGGRSPGIHVSSIIRNIAIENKLLDVEEMNELSLIASTEITDPIALARIGLGIGWERYYIPEVLSRYHNVDDHPPEICHDGIFMSRDGESVSVIITVEGPRWVTVIHEVKCTYKSTRTVGNLDTQWMWLAQIKAYCIARGTRFAVLHVLFVCGDYKYPIRPVSRAWQLEFSQEELNSNWDLLRDYKDLWISKQAGKENNKWLE